MQRIGYYAFAGLLAALPAAGCQVTSRPIPVETASGKPVAFWVQYEDRDEPVLLHAPYAIAVIWQGDDQRFYLFDGEARRVHKTTVFDAFVRMLNELPAGAVVQNITTCSAGLAYDMPGSKWAEVQGAIGRDGRTWARDPANHLPVFIVCTCGSHGLKWP